MNPIRLTEPELNDIRVLAELGSQTFIQSYRDVLDQESLQTYTQQAFAAERIAQELEDPQVYYLLALDHQRACAYAKLIASPVPKPLSLQQAIELQRLYVIPQYWGRAIGTRLMETLLEWAHRHHYQHMWLRVWQENERAIAFYQRWNFRIVGQEPYVVGNCSETVWLMSHDLPKVTI